jgi:hypothetical protein
MSKDGQVASETQGETAVSRVKKRRKAQPSPATRTGDGNLPLLHLTVYHLARQLWDIQEVRVAMSNRVEQIKRDGLAGEWSASLVMHVETLASLERAIDAQLSKLMRDHPAGPWIKATNGLGLPGVARLIGVVTCFTPGPMYGAAFERFQNVAKLWKYVGLDVRGGKAPRRERGIKSTWSPQGRKVCYQIIDSLLKVGDAGRVSKKGHVSKGSPYRELYLRRRAAVDLRPLVGPSKCPFGQEHRDRNKRVIECGDAHRHADAMRVAVKELLKDLWVEWKRVMPPTIRGVEPGQGLSVADGKSSDHGAPEFHTSNVA